MKQQMNKEFAEQLRTMTHNGEEKEGEKIKALMKSVRDLQQQIGDQQVKWRKRLEQKETEWRLASLDTEEGQRVKSNEYQKKINSLEDELQVKLLYIIYPISSISAVLWQMNDPYSYTYMNH